MLGFPTNWHNSSGPMLLISITVVLHLLPDSISSALNFNHYEIENGDYWRILSGQFLHSNYNHLLLNIAGLALVWALHGEYYQLKRYTLMIVISLLWLGLCVYFFSPPGLYFGLSGAIHFLLAFGACLDIRNREKTGYLLIFGLLIKVIYENVWGGDPATAELIGANVAVDAHAFGVVGGMLVGLSFVALGKKARDAGNDISS